MLIKILSKRCKLIIDSISMFKVMIIVSVLMFLFVIGIGVIEFKNCPPFSFGIISLAIGGIIVCRQGWNDVD